MTLPPLIRKVGTALVCCGCITGSAILGIGCSVGPSPYVSSYTSSPYVGSYASSPYIGSSYPSVVGVGTVGMGISSGFYDPYPASYLGYGYGYGRRSYGWNRGWRGGGYHSYASSGWRGGRGGGGGHGGGHGGHR